MSTFYELNAQYETKAIEIGRNYSNLMKTRARELIACLKPRFNITKILMGMGTFVLQGDDFKTVLEDEGDDELYTAKMQDLFDWNLGSGCSWEPAEYEEQDKLAVLELEEILGWLITNDYAQPEDITP